jgi:hypothetical protein
MTGVRRWDRWRVSVRRSAVVGPHGRLRCRRRCWAEGRGRTARPAPPWAANIHLELVFVGSAVAILLGVLPCPPIKAKFLHRSVTTHALCGPMAHKDWACARRTSDGSGRRPSSCQSPEILSQKDHDSDHERAIHGGDPPSPSMTEPPHAPYRACIEAEGSHAQRDRDAEVLSKSRLDQR